VVVVVVRTFEDEALAYTGPIRTWLLVFVVSTEHCIRLTMGSSRHLVCEERATEKGVVASTLAL
jgi:hypothetical protein